MHTLSHTKSTQLPGIPYHIFIWERTPMRVCVCTILSVVPNGFPFCEIHYGQYMHYGPELTAFWKYASSLTQGANLGKLRSKTQRANELYSYNRMLNETVRSSDCQLLFIDRTEKLKQMLIGFCIFNWVLYWCRSWLIPGAWEGQWEANVFKNTFGVRFYVCFPQYCCCCCCGVSFSFSFALNVRSFHFLWCYSVLILFGSCVVWYFNIEMLLPVPDA